MQTVAEVDFRFATCDSDQSTISLLSLCAPLLSASLTFHTFTFDDTFDIKMKLIALLTIQALAASAFTSVPSPVSRSALKHHRSTASQLFAATGETDGSISRREALQVASAAAVLAGTNVANADDEAAGGKLIEFTVNNLDGEEGKTGTFVVKTRPGK